MPYPKGRAKTGESAKHKFVGVDRPDPRTQDERRNSRGSKAKRNKHYSCSCGYQIGNVGEDAARKAWQGHRKSLGLD